MQQRKMRRKPKNKPPKNNPYADLKDVFNEDLVKIIVQLRTFFPTEEKVVWWLWAKNPHLGEIAPAQLILMGRGHKVRQFISNMLEGDLP